MTKPVITAAAIKAAKARALDALDKLEGRGRYKGDMGNFCYADGIFAASIKREFGVDDLKKLRKWAKT